MNLQRGYVELTTSEGPVSFQFGTNAYKLFCESNGGIELWEIPSTGLYGKLKKDEKGEYLKDEKGDLIFEESPSIIKILDLFYCAYKSHCLIKNLPVKLNSYQVTQLIEEVDGAFNLLQKGALEGRVIGMKGESEGNPQQPGI